MNNRKMRFFPLFLLLLIPGFLQAQMFDPVDWSFEKERISGDEFQLTFQAELESGWHLYSQHLPPDATPLPTLFKFKQKDGIEIIGEVEETGTVKEADPISGKELSFFKDQGVFKQKVKVVSDQVTEMAGYVEFMVCDDERCLPPKTVDFSFSLEKKEGTTSGDAKNPNENDSTPTNTEQASDANESKASTDKASQPGILKPVSWNFQTKKENEKTYLLEATAVMEEGWHLYATELPAEDGPLPTVFTFDLPDGVKKKGTLASSREPITKFDKSFQLDLSFFEDSITFVQKVEVSKGIAPNIGMEIEYMACDDERCIPPEVASHTFELTKTTSATTGSSESETDDEKKKTWLTIFFLGFGGGLAALLTPCVFPMIPLTVSFFTKQSKTRAKGISNAITYGLSIIVIYLLLGFGVTATFGPDAMNALSTNVWFNLTFFVLFVVFAISFFGAFEITLPSSWVNKADQASDKGGLIGTFFMAFTLSLVSFSCTGPIIGTLLVEAAVRGGVAGPLVGMGGFSFALALPFALFAAFPGWLNSLPQSGGWMNSVKVTLGFLELALALKFLSNADLVVQGGFLKRELFIAIWIGIFALLTIYLLGFIRMPNDSPMEKLPVPRMLLAMISLVFTIYLVPGLWGAPLKMISGFPPPMFYSETQGSFGGGGGSHSSSGNEGGNPEVAGDPAHCPHNLNCFHDYEEGLAYAKKVNKPVMLDFTGWACVNCRKMEEQVWSDPKVLSQLRNDVVLISLYVDEKTELPESKQKTIKIGDEEKKLRTVGNRWSYLQTKRFKTNTQPYYVMLDHEEEKLIEPKAYDPNVKSFANWLKKGVDAFERD